jgi:hypothetical protein
MCAPLLQLLRDVKGTALAEALIGLPVLVAVLAGVVALNGMYIAKLEAKGWARRMAWLQAESGDCPALSCQSTECGLIEGQIRSDGLDEPLDVRDSRFSLSSLLGDLGRFFLGNATTGIGVADAAMPSTVRPGLGHQSGVTTLLCNTRSRHTDAGDSVLEHACRTVLRTTEYASEVCK